MDPRTFDPGPLSDVELQATEGRWTLVLVRQLRHAPDKVWSALTDPDQLREWAPFIADRDLGTTGAATLTMIEGDEKMDLAASVTHADPPTVLEYTWGTDVVAWKLEPTGSGTRLTLRHTFADRDSAPGAAAGWHLCLVVLEHLLAGDPIGPIRGQDAMNYGWEALRDAYAATFGVAAGVGE